jgi:hypothetical protein
MHAERKSNMTMSCARLLGSAVLAFVPCAALADPSVPECPEKYLDLSESQRAGEFTCHCSSAMGKVYGTGIYTADSSICVAAMHVGLIDTQNHGGNVTLKAAPGCTTYASSEANAVSSYEWGKFDASFYFPAKNDGRCFEVELPKAGMKNPSLEKAVAAAYKRDYNNKVLRVILHGWEDEFETDDFGRVTGRDMAATLVTKLEDGTCELHYELWVQNGNGRRFSGPLRARGAGSKETSPIGCDKVEAPAKKKPKK